MKKALGELIVTCDTCECWGAADFELWHSELQLASRKAIGTAHLKPYQLSVEQVEPRLESKLQRASRNEMADCARRRFETLTQCRSYLTTAAVRTGKELVASAEHPNAERILAEPLEAGNSDSIERYGTWQVASNAATRKAVAALFDDYLAGGWRHDSFVAFLSHPNRTKNTLRDLARLIAVVLLDEGTLEEWIDEELPEDVRQQEATAQQRLTAKRRVEKRYGRARTALLDFVEDCGRRWRRYKRFSEMGQLTDPDCMPPDGVEQMRCALAFLWISKPKGGFEWE